MAKQRSGLGRGLNALFDNAEPRPGSQENDNHQMDPKKEPSSNKVNSSSGVKVGQKPDQADSAKKTGKSTEAASSKSASSSSVVEKKMPAAKEAASESKSAKAKQPEQNIVFSEDDVINARVVEREVPRNSNRPSVTQKKPKVSRPASPALTTEQLDAVRPSVSDSSTERTEQSGVGMPATHVERAFGSNHAPDAIKNATSSKSVDTNVPSKASEAIKESKSSGSAFSIVGDVSELPMDKVVPNPHQPRTNFKKDEIEELAQSIKKDGLLQPILVRKSGAVYEIIAGERRYQACKELGLKKIPARLWEADSDKALELALIENIQRSDLNPIEEAYGYKRLMERKGMTQSEVAQTVSKGRSTIANALRLLDLPEEAQQLLFEEKITAGHARAILSIPSAEGRKSLTKKLMDEKLSVREAESIARLLAGKDNASASASKRVPTPASFKKAARGLSRLLDATVRVKTVQGKNKIEIQFEDEEELRRIIDAISHK